MFGMMLKYLSIIGSLLLIGNVNCQNLQLRLTTPGYILENTNVAYQVNVLLNTNAPNCNLKLFKDSATIYHDQALTFVGKIADLTILGNVISAVSDNFDVYATLTCVDGPENLAYTTKTPFFSVSDFGSSQMTLIYTIAHYAGSQTLAVLTGVVSPKRGEANCNIAVDDTSKATYNGEATFLLKYSSKLISASKIGQADYTFFKMTCTEVSKTKVITNIIPLNFQHDMDPWAEAAGDPHLKQYIFDRFSTKNKQICYDITGSAGNFLHLAGFSKNTINVYGQLKDDYYMHRIVIKSSFGNITVSTDNIILDNRQNIQWNNNSNNGVIQTEFFKYQFFKTQISITSLKKFEFSMRIIQTIDFSISDKHLDVSFKLTPNDYQNMNGLFGDIGNKEYSFYPTIQSTKFDDLYKISVGVGKNIIQARRVRRSDSYCWLMVVNDILQPFKASNYEYKTII